tara:strand:- start:97 stop:327 length:231 start_codon:yes stop_codon:yes gene_type:complete
MKRLLLPLLLLLLSGCKYGSQFEAMQACQRQWGTYAEYDSKDGYRQCINEPSSRKVLGKLWKNPYGDGEVKKRFAY